MKMRCHINSLTHCKVADRLEQFLQTALGKRLFLKKEPANEHDPLAIAAYQGINKIGYVSSTSKKDAWAGIIGCGKPMLAGEIVAVSTDPIYLTFEADVIQLGDVSEIYSGNELESWVYSGPLLPVLDEQEMVETAAYELLELIAVGEESDEADEVFNVFMKLTRFDLSGEMSDLRSQILSAMEQSPKQRWQQAAKELRRLCNQFGGNHLKRELADYVTSTLPASREAQRMMKRARQVDTAQICRELEALPSGFYNDFLTDPTLFVSRLMYAHVSRRKVKEILSALTIMQLSSARPKQQPVVQQMPDDIFSALVTKPELAATVVNRLHVLMENQQKPRAVLMPIRAAMEAGLLKRPTWEQFCQEFGRQRVSSKSSFSSYTNTEKEPYTDGSFQVLVDEFRQMI